MLEKHVEAYLVKRVKEAGGLCEKFVSPANRSVPDRIVSAPPRRYVSRVSPYPNGGHYPLQYTLPPRVIFVELKAPGKKPTAAQERDHEQRRAMGFDVRVIDTKEGVDAFVAEVFRC